MEKTAVESIIIDLDNECKERGMFVNWDMYLAKEKKHIIKALERGFDEGCKYPEDMILKDAEEYYNETYKK
jgi:hypothetical protein